MPSIDSSVDLAAARRASANLFHAGICASVILRSALSAATRSPAWESFSCIIDIICVMRLMSPPIMSPPKVEPVRLEADPSDFKPPTRPVLKDAAE